jgi:adenosylcobinamide-GDP ribazoletransferase
MQPVRHFLLAIQFFTRIPITGRLADWVGFGPQMLNAASGYFAAVGVVVGVFVALVWLAVLAALGVWRHEPGAALAIGGLAALGATMAGIWLTGAFHEDGLADTFDALGGYVSRERALSIMKDSRIGTYGAAALVLGLGCKCALLGVLWALSLRHGTGLAAALVAGALVTAHSLSRASVLLVMQALPYVGDQADAEGSSKAKPLAEKLSAGAWAITALTCVGVALAVWVGLGLVQWHLETQKTLVSTAFSHQVGEFARFDAIHLVAIQYAPLLVMSAAVCALVAWRMVRWLRARLGGFTGDTLGATQQLSELAVYALWVLAAVWR